jgi:hypothetical protein
MHFVKDLAYICNAATPAVHADKSIPDSHICLKSVCDYVSMSLLSFLKSCGTAWACSENADACDLFG